MTSFARIILCGVAAGLCAGAVMAQDLAPVLPNEPPLPEPVLERPHRRIPVRLSLAAQQPDPFSRFDAPLAVSTVEVPTPIPNLWFGVTDLSLPLRPSSVEDPGGLIDSLSGSSPMLRYRLTF